MLSDEKIDMGSSPKKRLPARDYTFHPVYHIPSKIAINPLNPPPTAFAVPPAGGTLKPSGALPVGARFLPHKKITVKGARMTARMAAPLALDCFFSVRFYGNTDGAHSPEGARFPRFIPTCVGFAARLR